MTVLLLLALLWNTAAGSNFSPEIARQSLPSCNEVTLICQVQTVGGFPVRVENSRFLANDTDIRNLLTGTEFVDSDEGEITFTLRQELEAVYKCGNGSYTSTNSIPLITCPTRTEVDTYHAVPVGQEVSLACGVRQGKLASYYHPMWKKGFATVDTTSPTSLYRLRREELEDFSLIFLNPNPSDSGTYLCDVEVEQENGPSPRFFVEEEIIIELLVYERPVITYMTGDTTVIIHTEESKNITFICNATGLPDLTVVWLRNGEKVVSNEDYSIYESPSERAISSRLIMSDPKLTDSGNITCIAKVNFRTDAGGNTRSTETPSTEITRNIVILDTSPSVTVTVTQDSDLLVKISLSDTVFFQPVRLYFNFTENNRKNNIELKPDSKYSGVSVIYHFIAASQVPDGYRRFWLQVALVVDDEVGPYNPPVLTSPLITDLDDQTEGENGVWSTTVIVVIPVAIVAALALCIVACLVACICINRHNKKKDQHVDDNRQKARTAKFTETQNTIRHLSQLLLLANEEQAVYIRTELSKLQEQSGRLAADGAEMGGIKADDSEEETEIDSQKALTDYLETLKDLALSEQFTQRLEEMCSKVSNPNPTAGAAGDGRSDGELGNGPEKESEI